MIKVFKVADIRKLDQKCMKGEISYSRKVELINEIVSEAISKVEKLPIQNVSQRSEPLIAFGRYWGVEDMGNNGSIEYMVSVYLEAINGG